MKETRNLLTLLGLVLLIQQSWAQGGYNYGRPDVANAGNIAPLSNATPTRPVSAAFPTGTSTAAAAFPTAATAYGAGNVNIGSGTAFGSFGAQTQRGGTGTGFTPTAAGITGTAAGFSPTAGAVQTTTAGFAGNAAAAAAARRPSTLPQRTTGSVYGAAGGIGAQPQFTGSTRGGGGGVDNNLDTDYDGDFSAIPGVPGVDYPIYSQVPPTSFDCAQQPLPGYYSDVEAQCQVFHICALNRTYSFLCPNGTVFSQETLVCVWWNQYDCISAPSLYANNAFIYDYGNQGPPTNAVLPGSPTQLGVVSGTRTQSNYPTASTIRTPTATAGIFGSGNIRPTITGSNFPGLSTPITSVPPVNFPDNTAAGRFAPAAQTFPTATPRPVTPAPFGAVLRSNGGGAADANTGSRSGTAFPNAALTSTSSNRQYLPPSRRN